MDNKYKKVLMAAVVIIIFSLMGIWVYNQFIAEPNQNPVGTVNTDYTQSNNNNSNKTDDISSGDFPNLDDSSEEDVDPIYKGLDEYGNRLPVTEGPDIVPEAANLDASPISDTFDRISISVGSDNVSTDTLQSGKMPLNIIITSNKTENADTNEILTDTKYGINLVNISIGSVSTPEYTTDILSFGDGDNTNISYTFLRTGNSLYGFDTSYIQDTPDFLGWNIPLNSPDNEDTTNNTSIVGSMTISIVGIDTGYNYGYYDINMGYNFDSKTYYYDSINPVSIDETIKSNLIEKATSQAESIMGVPAESIKVYQVSRILDDYMTKDNGWEVVSWMDIPSEDYPIYAAIANFNEITGSYLAIYYNSDMAYIGYNNMPAIDMDELAANGYV